MVLQPPPEPSSQDPFDQSAPANDEDRFAASQSGESNSYLVDGSLLRPFPLPGRFGHYQDVFQKTVRAQVHHAQQFVKRPLTQDEVDAYAQCSARMISQTSYATPIGVTAGFYGAYRTASNFRFPMWQPNPDTFNPEVFPPRLAVFKGNRAIMAWHAMRVLAYSILNSAFAGVMITSYATTSAAANMYIDERLKDVNEAITKNVRSRRGLPQPPIRQEHGTRQIPQDDASPTGGMYGDGDAETENSNGRDEKPGARQWRKASKPPPLQEVHESEDTGFAVYDDASPTGGQGVAADAPSQQTSGSAWDRLRRGEKSTQNKQAGTGGPDKTTQQQPQSAWSKLRNSPQQGQQDSSSTGDSFSYTETYEQRELAKTQAQKEFDAQVERERRGGNFDDNGDQKRW